MFVSSALAFSVTGSGPPVVILHGLFGSATNWRRIAEGLSDQRQIFSVDLPNHGESPWTDDMSYPAQAALLADFLSVEVPESPILIGHSMGGKVAMTLALQHEILLGALVVVDIAPTAYPHTHEPLVEAMKSLDLAAIRNRREAEMQLEKAIPEKALRQFLLQNLRSTSDGLRWRINLEVIHRQMGALTGFDVTAAPCVVPSLFIYGTQSDYVTPKTTPAILKHFPKARLMALEGAGHWLHAQEPQRFIQAFQEFADALET
ncbi:MAG: alpha/beta hydrolase [Acidiferrobacter sp.]|nr:alpha/beta hydrolase [Acidiferrobacter sp.]